MPGWSTKSRSCQFLGQAQRNQEKPQPNWASGTGIPASPSGRAAEGVAGAGGGGVRGRASAPGGPGNTGKSQPHGFARPGLHLHITVFEIRANEKYFTIP